MCGRMQRTACSLRELRYGKIGSVDALILHGAWGAEQALSERTRCHADREAHWLTAWELDLRPAERARPRVRVSRLQRGKHSPQLDSAQDGLAVLRPTMRSSCVSCA